MFRWFERHCQFPAITDIPEELIWSGVEFFDNSVSYHTLLEKFGQERVVNRDKQEIKDYFGYRNFDPACIDFQRFMSEHILEEENDETLLQTVHEYLKSVHVEIPSKDILIKIIQQAKFKKEAGLFEQLKISYLRKINLTSTIKF
ncbi:DUF4158 domain-containing protein [Legionella clemsonensis]|uniref:Uncharacterized protein n=1 Tax=Legionella clemsonensis TaxID=1867846 RepID=A0A222NYR8_9GAMM|nr:DUF4158 domain-containing protein [Legionella clemsonensis]ASQ44726.1 hypothetical protein clem_00800 [Legionella clemsonensis]